MGCLGQEFEVRVTALCFVTCRTFSWDPSGGPGGSTPGGFSMASLAPENGLG